MQFDCKAGWRRGNACVADSALNQAGLSRVSRRASASLQHFAKPLSAESITEIQDDSNMSSAMASCSARRFTKISATREEALLDCSEEQHAALARRFLDAWVRLDRSSKS